MSMLTKLHALVFVVLVAGTAGMAHAQIAVVVSARSDSGTLSQEQVADIFLGVSVSSLTPVDQTEGAALRTTFYQKLTGKSQAQLKTYWSKLIFTGKGNPPKQVGDNAGVKRTLADNPNAIGYIDRSALDGSVKEIHTVR